MAADGEAGASSRQNDDIEEQETGVESVSKLPRIVPIVNYAGGGRQGLYYAFESAARNDIWLSTLSPGFHQHGPRYQLTNSSHPAEVSPSLLCSAPHSPFLTIAFPSLPISRRNEPGITATLSSAHPKRLKCSPHGFRLATSLFLSPYADIPTFSASMSRMREQKVRFLSFFSLQTRERLSPCLERVVCADFVAECRGFRRDPVRHCFHFFTLRHSPAY